MSTTDIRNRIEAGMSSLIGFSVDTDRMNEPYFVMTKHPDGRIRLDHSGPIGIPHCTGRALDALLTAESITGIPIPAEVEEALTFYHFASFSNRDGLNSYVDYQKDGQRFIQMHNIREGLLGLVALIKYRSNARAREVADRMLNKLNGLTTKEGAFSAKLAEQDGIIDRLQDLEGPPPMSSGRFIRALVRYHCETKSMLALDLASRYANYNLKTAFTLEGGLTEAAGDHGHSITSTVESILEYAIFIADENMIDHCRRIYDRGLRTFRSDTGWCSELVSGQSGRGEANNTGDLIQIALLLGQHSDTRYFEDAERFMRSHLLPAQLMDAESLPENAEGAEDCFKNIRTRAKGSFGFPLVNDRFLPGEKIDIATMDITSGAVQALCAYYQSIVERKEKQVIIHLFCDIRTPEVTLTSFLPDLGKIEIAVDRDCDLSVRVPLWVDEHRLSVQIDGDKKRLQIENGYLLLDHMQQNSSVMIEFDLTEKITEETLLDTSFTIKWRGNQVLDVKPAGIEQPLFP